MVCNMPKLSITSAPRDRRLKITSEVTRKRLGDGGLNRRNASTILSRMIWNSLPASVTLLYIAGALAAQNLVVDVAPSHVANSFSPVRALGAAVDRLEVGAADKVLVQPMLQEILSSGWQPVTYRQNTELEGEAWHWNPRGTWSDSSGRGYFTGSATPTERILHSWGYTLPHRGTAREGRNYGVITDGDSETYWKSNPYLTRLFTGEDDSQHPQWVIVDLGSSQKIDAIRIEWGEPYAKDYRIQFWSGGESNPRRNATQAIWQTFPAGTIIDGRGGSSTVRLTALPVSVRYIRIWMMQSSNTCDAHGSADRRNCVGYAIREVSAGTIVSDGAFQ